MMIWIQIYVEILDRLHKRFLAIIMTIFMYYHLIANFDKIAAFFFTKVWNINQKAVPVIEAIGTSWKFSLTLSGLRRSGFLSKTSGISDTEDSEQNE